jgi:hypothetical protein
MTTRQGAGALSSTQREPCPRAAAMVPSNFASENPILFAIRSNRLLDQIRHSDSSLQVLHTARLVGDLAAITSTLTMSFADLIFRFMSGEPAERLQQRFSPALQAVDTINDLCAQSLVLRDWFFSEEHCHFTARLLGAFTGSACVLPCPPRPLQHLFCRCPAGPPGGGALSEHSLLSNAQQRLTTARSRSMPGPSPIWLLVQRPADVLLRPLPVRPRPSN